MTKLGLLKQTALSLSLILLLSTSAYCAIVIEDTAIGGNTSTSSTISVTVSGSNTMMISCIVDETYFGASAVTYNGTSLTRKEYISGGNETAAIWYLINPDAGTHDLVVTHPGLQPLIAMGMALSGTEQQEPEASENEVADGITSLATDITTVTVNALIVGTTGSNSSSGSFSAVSGQVLQGQQGAPGGSSFEGVFYTKVTTTKGANSYTGDKGVTSSNLSNAVVSIAEVQTAPTGAPSQIW